MMNNYQCTGCGVVISADPDLTPTVQCAACSTMLSLGPSAPQGMQSTGASTFMDYQCPGCGATNSADPMSTPEVRCNTCMTLIKLGHSQPQEAQSPPLPASGPPLPASSPPLPAASPPLPAASPPLPAPNSSIPEPGAVVKSGIPELGAAAKNEIPELGPASKGAIPELGAAAKDKLPQLGGAVKKDLPELGAAVKKESSEPEATAGNETVAPVSIASSATEIESVPEESSIDLSEVESAQKEPRVRPAWLKFLLQPRVLTVLLGVAPVMITVIAGAILVFIRCGTGIANGEGDLLIQGGQIILGLASLWAMYILGMTFYYADRDWVTDFGHFVMIGGGIWGMYAVVSTFPSTFVAILGHLFFGYVALAAIALAVWLLAPYKGIGSPR